MNETYKAMTECAAEAVRVAGKVRGELLDGPTTCAEFDLRALVNHWVLYTSYGLERRALKQPLPEELVARDFTAEDGWAAAYAAQLDRALQAWADPAAWEGEIPLGDGRTGAAPQIAALIVKEMAVHGWDVARSIGEDFAISDDSAAVVLHVVEENAELYRQYQGFAAPVEVPASAPLFTRALALSGRDPHQTV
ncbi:TIGR03086 family metal-binding protein [Actinocorallia populi]|uniref:TIGR03086 family metal-binding protein n=1 Tax=Actinocorallia populi TaxID=2079200 RepID=UPI000D08E7A2|nr:TIGR03086 family metal-binding protein [Actinocorallia populi]